MNLIGQRIKALRKNNKLTQEELGKMLNVTKVSVCCYEKGTRTPSLETLIDLANIFRVSLDYLVGNDYFVVADQRCINVSKEEIDIMEELRNAKNNDLYQKLIDDPKRTIELINKKLR